MRSRSEQRIWDDIERFHAAEAAEPVLPGPHPARRRDGRGVDDPPVAVVAGTWCAIPLILFGAVVIGLAIGAATALGWLLWRSWPSLRDPDTTSAVPASRSSCAITADVYSHVGPAQQREAADRLDQALRW